MKFYIDNGLTYLNNSIIPNGLFKLLISDAENQFTSILISTINGVPLTDCEIVTNISKKDNTTYTSLNEFILDNNAFFQKSGGGNTDITGKEDISNKSIDIIADAASDTKYPSVKSIKTYVDNLVNGIFNYRGGYDASTNIFPINGGSGNNGSIKKGDSYIIRIAGVLGIEKVQVSDVIIANKNTPTNTNTDWDIINGNIDYIPEDSANKENESLSNSDKKYPTSGLVLSELAKKSDMNHSHTDIYEPANQNIQQHISNNALHVEESLIIAYSIVL